jgi:hypothetical protein
LQFANVSRPEIGFQQPFVLARELFKAAPHALREAPAEGFREEENIISTFSQSRKPNGKDVQAIKQVLTEASVGNFVLQAAVGRGDDTHVHLLCSRPSQRFELTFLQHAKQLGLQIERELANLVQEQGAPVRLRETPVPSSGCACEGSLLMPEEFALD